MEGLSTDYGSGLNGLETDSRLSRTFDDETDLANGLISELAKDYRFFFSLSVSLKSVSQKFVAHMNRTLKSIFTNKSAGEPIRISIIRLIRF
jgi:hypothetical protein